MTMTAVWNLFPMAVGKPFELVQADQSAFAAGSGAHTQRFVLWRRWHLAFLHHEPATEALAFP